MSIEVYNKSEIDRKFAEEFSQKMAKTPKNDEVIFRLWKWQIDYLVSRRIIGPAPKVNGVLLGLFEAKHWTFLDGSRPNTRIEERKYQSYVW